jgi:hypothetical protein
MSASVGRRFTCLFYFYCVCLNNSERILANTVDGFHEYYTLQILKAGWRRQTPRGDPKIKLTLNIALAALSAVFWVGVFGGLGFDSLSALTLGTVVAGFTATQL